MNGAIQRSAFILHHSSLFFDFEHLPAAIVTALRTDAVRQLRLLAVRASDGRYALKRIVRAALPAA